MKKTEVELKIESAAKNLKFFALIDEGRFSGKHPFVKHILTNQYELSEETNEMIYNNQLKKIEITEEEYWHLFDFETDIEVLYCEEGNTIEQKFFIQK